MMQNPNQLEVVDGLLGEQLGRIPLLVLPHQRQVSQDVFLVDFLDLQQLVAQPSDDVTVDGVGADVEGPLGLGVAINVLERVHLGGGRHCRAAAASRLERTTGLDQLLDNIHVACK